MRRVFEGTLVHEDEIVSPDARIVLSESPPESLAALRGPGEPHVHVCPKEDPENA